MVAVAQLPPAATLGIMLGAGQFDLAIGAGLLLAINIDCVNLSAKLIFIFKGIKPRTWLTSEKARESSAVYTLIWIVSLAILGPLFSQPGAERDEQCTSAQHGSGPAAPGQKATRKKSSAPQEYFCLLPVLVI